VSRWRNAARRRPLQPTMGAGSRSCGEATNVRQSPGVTAEITGQKPEGEFYIAGGPSCVDGFAWWNLQFQDGTYGFVAEGDLNEYYLEPW
jgi:hypothetical protein